MNIISHIMYAVLSASWSANYGSYYVHDLHHSDNKTIWIHCVLHHSDRNIRKMLLILLHSDHQPYEFIWFVESFGQQQHINLYVCIMLKKTIWIHMVFLHNSEQKQHELICCVASLWQMSNEVIVSWYDAWPYVVNYTTKDMNLNDCVTVVRDCVYVCFQICLGYVDFLDSQLCIGHFISICITISLLF